MATKKTWTETDRLILRAAIRAGETLKDGALLGGLISRHPRASVMAYLNRERERMEDENGEGV